MKKRERALSRLIYSPVPPHPLWDRRGTLAPRSRKAALMTVFLSGKKEACADTENGGRPALSVLDSFNYWKFFRASTELAGGSLECLLGIARGLDVGLASSLLVQYGIRIREGTHL